MNYEKTNQFIDVTQPFTMNFDDVKVTGITKKFVKVSFHGWDIYILIKNFNKLHKLGAIQHCSCITTYFGGQLYRWLQVPSVF